MAVSQSPPDRASTSPGVSILLPVYNCADTLPDAISSLLTQTFPNFEIVAVNDGSTDDTGRILDRYSREDKRIRVLHPGRIGLVEALNHGLESCKAPLVARFDGDDRAHPERLASQVAYLEDHPGIDVVGSLVHCFADGEENVGEGFRIYEGWLNSLTTPDQIAREIYIESPMVHPSVTFRRDVIIAAGAYRDMGWPEDYELWLRLHTAGHRFAKIPEVLHDWREHPGRLTRTDGRYSVENFLRTKSHYLVKGPLRDSPGVIVWGAGQIGRRLSKHLERDGARLVAFVDIDPRKIGNTRRGAPIVSQDALPDLLRAQHPPRILAAVPSRGARDLIRARLDSLDLTEGFDYFCVA